MLQISVSCGVIISPRDPSLDPYHRVLLHIPMWWLLFYFSVFFLFRSVVCLFACFLHLLLNVSLSIFVKFSFVSSNWIGCFSFVYCTSFCFSVLCDMCVLWLCFFFLFSLLLSVCIFCFVSANGIFPFAIRCSDLLLKSDRYFAPLLDSQFAAIIVIIIIYYYYLGFSFFFVLFVVLLFVLLLSM